jgi:outer membrane protein
VPLALSRSLPGLFVIAICLRAPLSGRAWGADPAGPGPGGARALDLAECLRRAEAAASPVAVARRQREIAQARVTAARAALLPRLGASVGYTRNSPPLGAEAASDTGSFVSLNGVNEYSGLVTLTEEIDLSGRLRASGTRAQAEVDAAGATVGLRRRELRRAVAAAYYRLLLARRLVDVAGSALTEAQQFTARTELLAKQGEAARADIVRASAQVAFLRQSRRAAELEAELANQELASFWTDQLRVPLPLVEVLDQPPAPPGQRAPTEAARAFVLKRPEILLLDAQRRGLEAEARGARALRLPQAALVAEYGLNANRVAWENRGYALLFTLSVPIFDWGAASSLGQQWTLQAEQTALDRELQGRALLREYDAAHARVQALYEQIGITREQVSLSEQSLKLSRVRYEGGEGSALEVMSAQTEVAQARSNLYQALAGHLQARADLAIASGQ